MATKKKTRKAATKKAAPTTLVTAVKGPMTKSVIIGEIAGNTELTKKQVEKKIFPPIDRGGLG